MHVPGTERCSCVSGSEKYRCVLHSGIIFDVIVVYSGISRGNLVLTFGVFSGVKRATFAVCLIFWFELHVRCVHASGV